MPSYKNTITINAGSFLAYLISAGASYERTIATYPDYYSGIYGLISTHIFNSIGVGGISSSAAIGFIKGKGNHKLEMFVGILTIYNNSSTHSLDLSNNVWLPSGNIGYRFHTARGRVMFRMGVGFLDGVYLGTGIRF